MVETATEWRSERELVVVRRRREALNAGLTRIEARMFAESDCDIGLLRKLVAAGCDPIVIALIVL